MYDIFYASKQNINESDWLTFFKRFPTARKVENIKNFRDLTDRAFTKLFWVVWSDVEVLENFHLDYKVPKWDEEYVHVFKNGDHYDGINIFSRNLNISQKEFDHRFFSNKKEIDIVASTPKLYDIFTVDSYQEYLDALENSTTDMFWITSKNLKPHKDFKFDLYFPHHAVNERYQTHALIHRVGLVESYNGIFLCSKRKILSKKEVEHRFPIERVELDIIASVPIEYSQFSGTIDTYQDYLEALDRSDGTEMMWIVPTDVEVLDNFNFDTYFSHDNNFDRNINHVFLNGEHYDGVMLLSRYKKISEKEFKHRFIIDKKEWPIVASKPRRYPIFYIDNYEEYLKALNSSSTEMFWMTSRNLQVDSNFHFDLYFSHHNHYDRNQTHAFIHRVGDALTYNGIFLCSKNKVWTKKEVEHRFPIERKEWDTVASGPVTYIRYVAN
jgi:lipocalin